MIKTRHIGKFRIPRHIVDDCPEAVLKLHANIIVLEAQVRFDTDSIHYLAIGEIFPVCSEHCVAPSYRLDFDDAGQLTVEHWNEDVTDGGSLRAEAKRIAERERLRRESELRDGA